MSPNLAGKKPLAGQDVRNFLRLTQTTSQIEAERKQTLLPSAVRIEKQRQAREAMVHLGIPRDVEEKIAPSRVAQTDLSFYKDEEMPVDPLGFVGGLKQVGAKAVGAIAGKALPDNVFNVGITNVAGRKSFAGDEFVPFTKSDELFQEAKDALARGDKDVARKRYEESVRFGSLRINDAFMGTGIKVTTKPAYGIFEATAEPSIDLTAVVPQGKEGLFHFKLSELADSFEQKSIITYRNASGGNVGISNGAEGLSTEPFVRILFKEPQGVEKVAEINALLTKHGLKGGTLKQDGKALDIINLTHYNKDYGGFTKSTEAVIEELNSKGLLEGVRRTLAEVRHIGRNYGDGLATYKRVRGDFLEQNPSFKKAGDQTITSKVLSRLPSKELISKQEIQQLTKSPDIPTIEKETVDAVLAQLPEKFPVRDFDYLLRKSVLRITPEESSKYANYGLSSLELATDNASTVVFRTPIQHGVQGHLGVGDDLGHARTFELSKHIGHYDVKGIGSEYTVYNGDKLLQKADTLNVSELQSDPFQRGEGMIIESTWWRMV